jgi:hypothetical protein
MEGNEETTCLFPRFKLEWENGEGGTRCFDRENDMLTGWGLGKICGVFRGCGRDGGLDWVPRARMGRDGEVM